MKLIDKDALVAEIEKIKKEECPTDTYEGRIKLFYFERFLSFLDTIEVKKVDLNIEEELKKYGISSPKTRDVCIASHFYELGFKAQKGE